jgi:hypothetical protein
MHYAYVRGNLQTWADTLIPSAQAGKTSQEAA